MLEVELLQPRRHDRGGFTCGEPTLERYVREQAAQHHRDAIATTHVLIAAATPTAILGYYSLSAAQLALTDLTDLDRRRLPRHPVPAARMGRLAVSSSEQGKGHGAFLLAHAVARCLALREQLGLRVMIVDALHERAAAFYGVHGFRETSSQAATLYLPLGEP